MIRRRPGDPADRTGRQPSRLPVLLSVGTVVGGVIGTVAGGVIGGVTSNVLADAADNLLGQASIGLAVLGALGSIVLEVRRRWLARSGGTGRTDGANPGRHTGSHDARPGERERDPNLPILDDFVGRDEQVTRIVTELRGCHAVAVVGRRAVGTSYCAIKAAHECRNQFPQGQFYVDLRYGGRPWTARSVVSELTRIVGVQPPRSDHPDDLADAVRRLSRHVDGRRILLMLDNVDDPAQVRPLLPPTTSTCRLLLAGDESLGELPGVVTYRLSEPDPDDAERMYRSFVPRQSAARRNPATDPVLRQVLDLCGRQPRAIRVLAAHGGTPEQALRVWDETTDAAPPQPGDRSTLLGKLIRADSAYRALSPGARRLYRLLSLAPGPLDKPALEALAAGRRGPTVARLAELITSGFVETLDGRYAIADLLSGYARLHLCAEEPAGQRAAARTRLLRHLARQAERRWSTLPTGGDGPVRWFQTHQRLLLTALEQTLTQQPPAQRRRWLRWWYRLAVALCAWYAHTDQLDEWYQVGVLAQQAAASAGDRRMGGWAQHQMGAARRRQGQPERAIPMFNGAIEQLGRWGSAQALLNRGLAQLDLRRPDEAVRDLETARQYRARGDRVGRARTDLALGVAYLALNRPDEAYESLASAANTFHELADGAGYAAALANLVLVFVRMGEYTEAAHAGRELRDRLNDLPHPTQRAAALLNAGAGLITVNPHAAEVAYQLLTESRRLRDGRQPAPGYARTLLYLGDAARLLNRPEEAREHWVQAAEAADLVPDRECLAEARRRLAEDDTPAAGDIAG